MTFDPSSFEKFTDEYLAAFADAVKAVDRRALASIMEVLHDARVRGATVHVAGNGGSAAIANHFECDVSKGTQLDGRETLRSRSLAANTSVLTAIANDHGYDQVFEKQILYYAKPGDVVFLVSSSGNSPNMVRACKSAKEKGLVTVALVGFQGGALKALADHALHVPIANYGIVEDIHQGVIHLVTQYLRERWSAET